MKKWKYLEVYSDITGIIARIEELNKYGDNGWKLIDIFHLGGSLGRWYTFIKEI